MAVLFFMKFPTEMFQATTGCTLEDLEQLPHWRAYAKVFPDLANHIRRFFDEHIFPVDALMTVRYFEPDWEDADLRALGGPYLQLHIMFEDRDGKGKSGYGCPCMPRWWHLLEEGYQYSWKKHG